MGNILGPILLIAMTMVAVLAAYFFGVNRGGQQRKNLLEGFELIALSEFMESLSRFAAIAKKGDAFFLDGIVKIWRANFSFEQKELIIDLQQGQIINVSPPGQKTDWIYKALIYLQEDDFIWIDGNHPLAKNIIKSNSDALLFSVTDGSVTRLIVFYFPAMPAEKKEALAIFFKYVHQIAVSIRERSMSAATYERLTKELQNSNLRMKQLFSNVKHNMGNALTGVMSGVGMIALYREDQSPEALLAILDQHVLPNYTVGQEMLSQMYESIRAITEEQSIYEVESYELRSLFENLFLEWLYDINIKLGERVTISWDIPDDTFILTSELVFFQVLFNILKNAIKYTREGSITVSTFPGTDNRYYIRVSDTGVGIPEAHQKHIGNYGFRGIQEAVVEGEGIGLWGAYQLVNAVDGNMYFSSIEGEGTTFNIGFNTGDANA